MIKCETIGMLDRVVVNPVITSASDVANYSFITHDDELYLVANTLTGDNAYVDDFVIPAGEYLNGHLVKSLDGQKLVIDCKHIDADIEDIEEDVLLVVNQDGKLEIGEPDGVHFVVTDVNVTLTGPAVKAKVVTTVTE